jgi:pimeloyl-ACP methyl ester carboxylesterase
VALSSLDREVMLHFLARIAPTYDLRPRLSGVALPTPVMVGEEDWVTPPIGSRIIAESIPGGDPGRPSRRRPLRLLGGS